MQSNIYKDIAFHASLNGDVRCSFHRWLHPSPWCLTSHRIRLCFSHFQQRIISPLSPCETNFELLNYKGLNLRVSQNSLEWLRCVYNHHHFLTIAGEWMHVWQRWNLFFSRKQFEKWILALQATTPVTRMKFRCTHDDDSHFKSLFLVLFHLISSSRCHSSCIIADNRVVDSSSFDLCSLRMQFKMKWRSCWVHGKKVSAKRRPTMSRRENIVCLSIAL